MSRIDPFMSKFDNGCELEINYEGVWHSATLVGCAYAGPIVTRLQLGVLGSDGKVRSAPLAILHVRTTDETIVPWDRVWAIRHKRLCPECGGSGDEGLDGWGGVGDGPCAYCDGSGRQIPPPYADATAGLGTGKPHPGSFPLEAF
jgi:hypothetical protein